MPKLLLVGIVEKTCVKTVIREIPGITDCFNSKEDKNGETAYRVSHLQPIADASLTSNIVDHERFEHPRAVAICLQRCR